MVRYILKDKRTGKYYRHNSKVWPAQTWVDDISKATLFETIGGLKRSTTPWRCRRIYDINGNFVRFQSFPYEELEWPEIIKLEIPIC